MPEALIWSSGPPARLGRAGGRPKSVEFEPILTLKIGQNRPIFAEKSIKFSTFLVGL